MTDQQRFIRQAKQHYRAHGRRLPWRTPDLMIDEDGVMSPYAILVSEVMLQQTQVPRVVPKFREFMRAFPDVETLSDASLHDVLTLWQGLGYNRRAKYLHDTARHLVRDHTGKVPGDTSDLVRLPGIGPNTAGAIAVYAFNRPAVFIETNIRTVFLHHFFDGRSAVADSELVPLIENTLDKRNPREWYWALMDYGTHLKTSLPNPGRASKHHTVQSTFAGSRRQLRGNVLRELLRGPVTLQKLRVRFTDDRLTEVLAQLSSEGLIEQKNRQLAIRK